MKSRLTTDVTVSKKVFIKTFGCQMNEYDSDKMVDVLHAADGYVATQNIDEADLILFNTCSVREKAQEKVFSDLGRIKHLKAKGVKIGVGGCVFIRMGECLEKILVANESANTITTRMPSARRSFLLSMFPASQYEYAP